MAKQARNVDWKRMQTEMRGRYLPGDGPQLCAPFREVLVHGANRNRAFSDRTRHALHGAMSHVADGEHSRYAGFECERRSVDWPPLGNHVSPGEDESPIVTVEDLV